MVETLSIWRPLKDESRWYENCFGQKPELIHEKLDNGETVLYLCVKYNRLEALKTLVEDLQDNEFLLSSGDDDGNTILHLAAALKQMNTIKYLLGIKRVKEECANIKNRNGSTALDVVDHCPNRDLKTMEIREFLLQAGVRRSNCSGSNRNLESPPDDYSPPPPCGYKVLKVILQFFLGSWTKYVLVDPSWLKEVRGHLITAATLTATMAYQAILSPPGGFWQENKDGHIAGTAILNDRKDMDYYGHTYDRSFAFLGINTVVLFGSLCTIMLALSGLPHRNKWLLWLLIFTVYITLSCMAMAYEAAVTLLFPSQMKNPIFRNILDRVHLTWFSVTAFFLVLHALHFLVWFANLVKRCFCGRQRRRRPGPNNPIP